MPLLTSVVGAFWQLEAKLKKLASGDWKGGKFSIIVGTQAQKKYFKSPLLKANAGKKLRILWQIDVGYCEDGVHRQHVKSEFARSFPVSSRD